MIQDPRYGKSQTYKVFEEDLIKLEKSQKALLCEISSKLGDSPVASYNTNEQFVVSDTGTLTLAANTYHSISYSVLSGTANITVGGTLLGSVPAGFSSQFEATTLLTNSIIFTGLSSGSKIAITTLK